MCNVSIQSNRYDEPHEYATADDLRGDKQTDEVRVDCISIGLLGNYMG